MMMCEDNARKTGACMLHLAMVLVLTCGGVACEPSEEFQHTPFVQDSSGAEARWVVDISRIQAGVLRGYAPRCIDTVRVGETVEFRNFTPSNACNVSSIAGPATLYSPNLVRPYNYVAADDAINTLCDVVDPATDACTKRPAWSYWRFTFTQAGVYDYIDTHQSEPGRKIVDPYYGTVTFVGLDPNAAFGTICVKQEDGSGCDHVCCQSDAQCTNGMHCTRGSSDGVGRCVSE